VNGPATSAAGPYELWSPRSDVRAVVSRRAAALRALRVRGADIVEPTLAAPEPPGMAGAVLAPWPNRVEGARWFHNGRELQLAVTEPELGHANHGLLASTDFESAPDADPRRLRLRTRIDHAPGYPFTVEIEVAYQLLDDGVKVVVTTRNAGPEPAPVALGAHPYLRIGAIPSDQLTVLIDADVAHALDATHIPRRRFPVDGTAWDLRTGRSVRAAPGHATFERSTPAGSLRHALVAPDGSMVELRADADFRFTQLWLAEHFDADDGPRLALAIEPMTAPPNALRTGIGLRMLEPGEVWRAGFSIELRRE
jgi:aldose 1-epimerase